MSTLGPQPAGLLGHKPEGMKKCEMTVLTQSPSIVLVPQPDCSLGSGRVACWGITERSGEGQSGYAALATFLALFIPVTCFHSCLLCDLRQVSCPFWAPHRQRRLDAMVPPLPVPCATCATCAGVWQDGELDCAKASWAGSQRVLWAREFELGDSQAYVGDSSPPGCVTLAGSLASLR